MSSTFLTIIMLLLTGMLGLKIFEMMLHTILALRNKKNIKAMYDSWPLTDFFERWHLGLLFRLPTLVIIISLMQQFTSPKDTFWYSAIAVFGGLWTQLIQSLVTKLTYGIDDAVLRRLVLMLKHNRKDFAGITKEQANRDSIIFYGGFITIVIFGYAGIFRILANDPKAFNVPLHGLVDCLYFSMTTFATVGYGDISAAKELPRLTVFTEIAMNVGIIIMLLLSYTLMTQKTNNITIDQEQRNSE